MFVPADSQRRSRFGLLAVLAILVVGMLCYGIGLDGTELDKEEARRAVPAREMIASGDFVVPTVWQRTYLAKPPLLFWTIAAVGQVRGQVDELAARLPSVVATILTALGLLAFAGRVLGARTGVVAGLLLLISPGVFEKGSLGELEATLALYVFGATASLWLALAEGTTRRSRVTFTLLASASLCAATMTKGPVALLFYGAALVGVVVARQAPRLLLRAACWLPVLLALGALGTWAAMVMLRFDSEQAVDIWVSEIARAKDLGVGSYFHDRQRFVTGALLAFFPGSWICIAAWLHRRRTPAPVDGTPRVVSAEAQAVRFLAIALVVSLTFFLLQPGVRPRFCYPALPWCTALGGHLLIRSLADPGRPQRLVRALMLLVALIGVALVVGGVTLHVMPIAELQPFDLGGHLLLAITALAAILSWHQRRKPMSTALLIAPLVILVSARLIHTTQLIPQREANQPKHAFGQTLDRLVPAGEAIDVRFWFGFNELSYTSRRLVFREPQSPIGAHRFLLAPADQVELLRANSPRDLPEIATLRLLKGTDLRLLEVR